MKKKQKYIIIIFTIASLFTCETYKTRTTNEAIRIIQKMTLPEKIGQMMMLGIPERKLTDRSVSIINSYMPGGIILFGYNLGTSEEIKKYIDEMQQRAIAKFNIPLFISIDQEGGRVKRITDGVTQFPGNMAFGIVDNESFTYDAARITGIELKNIGINMNLTPALDVNNNPLNPVINTRSFGSDVKIVSRLGSAYIKGLQRSGCIAVGKHFPGHGDTDKDSHLTLPVINHDITRLRKIEFPPFIEAVDSGVEAIMTAHIAFPNILKNNLPATMSKQFLTDILRGEMQFNGVIITDDMEMNAVSKVMDLGEGAVKSILAGADIILVSTYGKSIEVISRAIKKAVDNSVIPVNRINESVMRIIELKLRYNIMNLGNGKFIQPEFNYSKDDLDIVKNAGQLNSIVSKEALYFYSEGRSIVEPLNDSKSIKIFITSNVFLRKEIENKFTGLKDKKYLIFNTEMAFVNYFSQKLQKGNYGTDFKNAFIYYQFDKTDGKKINEINKLCNKFDLKLYLLCTGNPFQLSSIKELPPVLYSFSNTDESIKQMFLCLEGEFKPKEKINIFLGLK
jgi:beta-N-acetylhexosaminidase